MKRKLFLAFALVIAFTLMLTIVAFADTVHNENTVDYNATVTLNDGTVCNLFDADGNALIWYIASTSGGKNVYASVRADDGDRIKWTAEGWDEVKSWNATLEDGTTSIKSNIVVINLMDDDVIRNTGNANFLGKPMDNFKQLFEGLKNLEYCYLRLDTRAINTNSFNGCSKLKYINLEDLTQLKTMAQNYHFSGCTSLFDGQVLDLTKTQLTHFEGFSTFSGVPLKAVKFPETMTKIGSKETFNNCTKLEAIYIGNKTKLGSNSFNGCTSIKAIFYVGTETELDSFVTSTDATNTQITGATKISYTAYKALSDTEKASKTYVIYDYSSCLYGNPNEHDEATPVNVCVGTCNECGAAVVSHKEATNLTVTIAYTSYAQTGDKRTACNNEGCTYDEKVDFPALFECLGYSVGPDGYSLKSGFLVDNDALNEYKALYPSFSFGIVMANAGTVASSENFIVNQSLNSTAKGFMISIESLKYASWNVDVAGFNASVADSLELIVGIYTKDTEGNVKVCQYVNADKYTTTKTYKDMSLSAITFNQVRVGHRMDALVAQSTATTSSDEE